MKDELKLDYFLSVGGELAVGDECRCKSTNRTLTFKRIIPVGESYPGNYEFTGFGRVVYMKCELDGFTITSFAERENKGVQPVPDDFRVVANLPLGACSRLASEICWPDIFSRVIVTWKPDYEALLKMQAEHDKHNESIIKACDEANKKESEMVYTQDDYDNNIAPKRGMKVLIGGLEPDSRIIDFEGAEVTIINVHSASNLITFSHGLIGCGCGYFSAENKVFHPIKTPEEIELEEAKKKQRELVAQDIDNAMSDIFGDTAEKLAMMLQKRGHLKEIMINDLGARGMAKQ